MRQLKLKLSIGKEVILEKYLIKFLYFSFTYDDIIYEIILRDFSDI